MAGHGNRSMSAITAITAITAVTLTGDKLSCVIEGSPTGGPSCVAWVIEMLGAKRLHQI